MSDKDHIGVKIGWVRAMKRYSQEELGGRVNKSRSLIGHIEQTGEVNDETLEAICKEFGMSREELENFSGEPVTNYAAIKQREDELLKRIEDLERIVEHQRETIISQANVIQQFQERERNRKD